MSDLAIDTRAVVGPDPEAADACAAILNDWIDATDWMPRVHSHDNVVRFYREQVLPKRTVYVAGSPVDGFIAVNEGASLVMALYVRRTGAGIGRALLERAKAGRKSLELWTFVANEGARSFYHREGFREVARSDGDNEEGLPDIRLRWERAA